MSIPNYLWKQILDTISPAAENLYPEGVCKCMVQKQFQLQWNFFTRLKEAFLLNFELRQRL